MSTVRCNNCMKEFSELAIIYDGELDEEFCPCCGENGYLMDIHTDVETFCGLYEPYDTLNVTFAEDDIQKFYVAELLIDEDTKNVVAMRLTKLKDNDDWIVRENFYLKNIDMFKKIENG